MTFQDFNFDPRLQDGLVTMGYSQPTPIQEKAIPVILENRDIIACAQTGTGKTAAYVLPILNKIVHTETRHLNTLIIAPTRELAQQIDQQVEGLAYFLNVSSISVYGGGDGSVWDQQKRALEAGVDIIIATPGRLIALLAAGTLNFKHLHHLVLDEADRMLDMGFYDDIIRIISYLPQERQTLLFSATMPPRIRALANKILVKPAEVSLAISKPAEGILQQAYMVYDAQKVGLIKHLLKNNDYGSVIIFAATRENVKKLDASLRHLGLKCKAFHSDLEQEEREQILREFKGRQLPILIGTDILSRGIDVEGIELIINFDVPHDAEDYVHRIGRTARAARTGTAITLVNEKDQRKFSVIENMIGITIPAEALPEELGSGPEYSPKAKEKRRFHKNRPSRGRAKGRK